MASKPLLTEGPAVASPIQPVTSPAPTPKEEAVLVPRSQFKAKQPIRVSTSAAPAPGGGTDVIEVGAPDARTPTSEDDLLVELKEEPKTEAQLAMITGQAAPVDVDSAGTPALRRGIQRVRFVHRPNQRPKPSEVIVLDSDSE